ncbi:MAG: metal-dependent transcriptional regulator, partial [Methanoculleus sp.]
MRHRGCRINLSRRVEDYLEAILNVTREKGYARTKDVAREL